MSIQSTFRNVQREKVRDTAAGNYFVIFTGTGVKGRWDCRHHHFIDRKSRIGGLHIQPCSGARRSFLRCKKHLKHLSKWYNPGPQGRKHYPEGELHNHHLGKEGNGGGNGATSDPAPVRRKEITYSSQGPVSYRCIPKTRHPFPESRKQSTLPDIGVPVGPNGPVEAHHVWDSGWGKHCSFHIFRCTPFWASCKHTDWGYSWGTECIYPRIEPQ